MMDIGKNIDSAGVNNQEALELAAKINAGKYAKKKIENSSTTEFFIKNGMVDKTKIRNAYNKESYKAAMNHSVTSNFVDKAIRNLTNREVTNGNKREMLQQLQNLKVKLQLEEITKDLTNPKIPYEKKIATLQSFKTQILNDQETKNLVWVLEKLDAAKYKLVDQQFKSAEHNTKTFKKSLDIDKFSKQDINTININQNNSLLGKGGLGQVHAAMMTTKTEGKRSVVVKTANQDESDLEKEFNNSQNLIANAEENMLKPAYDKDSQKDGNLLGYQQGLQSIALTKGISRDEDGSLYTVQDRITGKDLSQGNITFNTPYSNGFVIDPQTAIQRSAGFLSGIVAIHEQGFVHKDIKPENLMIENNADSNYAAKIIDLGSLDSIKNPQRSSSDGITPSFRPPELYGKSTIANYTSQQEMFAVGLTLPSLLFGAACNDLVDSYLNNEKNSNGSMRFAWKESRLIETYLNRPHTELQKFMRDEFTKINNSQVENGNTGYPQEVIDQLGNLVADCLMMKPKFLYDEQGNLIQDNKDLDIGPYKDENGNTLRRPTSEEALQILTNLGLSDWETGHFSIQ